MKDKEIVFLTNWYNLCVSQGLASEGRIRIFTIDNPGFGLIVKLLDTYLEGREFTKVRLQGFDEDTDWIHCFVRDEEFNGVSDPLHFLDALNIFQTWVEDKKDTQQEQNDIPKSEDGDFAWLQQWYEAHCDGDWEHCFGVEISTTSSPGWHFAIEVDETELEGKCCEELTLKGEEPEEWLYCALKQNKFEGTCGPKNLPDVFRVFREWAESEE